MTNNGMGMRSISLVWMAWVTLGISAAKAQDSPPAAQGNLWAILVGVNDYAELEDLQYCRKDVEALAEQLVKVGFPRDGVFVLTDGAADAKNQPSKINFETRLKIVLKVAKPGDLVLVSFSGHGVCISGQTYLCPSDARLDNPEATMIPLQLVYRSLEQSQASRKLLWVDACRNDPRPSGARSAGAHEQDVAGLVKSLAATPKGILTLASCATDQISWEDEQLGHGVFMHFLMEGLSGKADAEEKGNRDACVSILELYNYAYIKTTRLVADRREKEQTPELFGRVTGDFDLVRLDVRPVMPDAKPPATSPSAPISRTQGETITNTLGMQLKLIPAGEFLMGSPDSEDVIVMRDAVQAMAAELVNALKERNQTNVEPTLEGFDTLPGHIGLAFKEMTKEKLASNGVRMQIGANFKYHVRLVKSQNVQPPQSMTQLTGELMDKHGQTVHQFTRQTIDSPQHRVRITKPFYLGVYEVTQGQYEEVMGKNPSSFKGPDLPVESVSWEEATEFCRRLSTKEGRFYRLPTEAEWEYACRAGTTTPFAFGETLSSEQDANFNGNGTYGGGMKGRYVKMTMPVGSYRANTWGLYDMHGNVREWCADWYGESYYATSPRDDPPGPPSGSYRVDRGGGWSRGPIYCRSAGRFRHAPDAKGDNLGYRVALVPAE